MPQKSALKHQKKSQIRTHAKPVNRTHKRSFVTKKAIKPSSSPRHIPALVSPAMIQQYRSFATVQRVFADGAPEAIGPYCHATKVGDMVFISGQLGLNAPRENPNEPPSFEAQSRQALQNLELVAKAAGSDLKHIAKTTVLLTDMANFPVLNGIYAEFFPGDQVPARACFAVKQLPANGLVEIEAVATVAKNDV